MELAIVTLLSPPLLPHLSTMLTWSSSLPLAYLQLYMFALKKKKQKYFVGMRNAFLVAFKNTEHSNSVVATAAAIYAAQQ